MFPPSQDENPHGFHRRYNITKADGTPVDPNAVYLVLRIDKGGKDQRHIENCRYAAAHFADATLGAGPDHLQQFAEELNAFLDRRPEQLAEYEKQAAALAEQAKNADPENYKPDASMAGLLTAIRQIESWLPDCLPASEGGKIPYGRALAEVATSHLRGALTLLCECVGALKLARMHVGIPAPADLAQILDGVIAKITDSSALGADATNPANDGVPAVPADPRPEAGT